MVPISSVRISRVLTYSGSSSLSQSFVYGDFTLFVLPFQVIRLLFLMLSRGPYPEYITTFGLGSSDFARHYFRNHCFVFFSSGYLDVSVPRVPLRYLWIQQRIIRYYSYGVPSFGYLRFIGYLLLRAAFRSLSRPSSAPCTKAFSVSPL